MLKTSRAILLTVGLSIVAPALPGPTGTGAQSETPRAPQTAADETDATGAGSDLVTAAREVQVDTDVGGDAALAGANVTVSGRVNGYLMGAGRTVRVEGDVGNDLWAAGETVTVDGSIGDNAMLAGRTVRLTAGTIVGHDASLAGDDVTAGGRIEGDLRIGAATARIGADVGGTVSAQAARVVVLPGATIRGDLVVRAPEPPDVSPEAQVMGEVRYEEAAEGGWAWPWTWLLSFLALLILGFAALAFSRAWVARVAGTLQTRVGRSLLAGVVLLVVVPLAAGVLLITIVGIPLGLIMLALYAVALLLSSVFVSYRLGQWLLDRMKRSGSSPWGRMALGVLVVSLGIVLPAVGWLVALGVVVTGAGALALERREARARLPTAGRS